MNLPADYSPEDLLRDAREDLLRLRERPEFVAYRQRYPARAASVEMLLETVEKLLAEYHSRPPLSRWAAYNTRTIARRHEETARKLAQAEPTRLGKNPRRD